MGRPTKRAAKMRQQRLNETGDEREKRLSQVNECRSKTISKETREQREKRLSKMRTYLNNKLKNENTERRAHRHRLIQERLSSETEEQHAHRLSLMHERLSSETEEERAHRFNLIYDRLSNETEEQRAHRLNFIHDRLSNETEKQRSHRLNLIRDRLSKETDEQRAHRLNLIHDRLSNETEEQRAHRLNFIHDRLSNETEKQRSHRLNLINDRLSNETEEQRAHRLNLIYDRLSNETEKQRSHRLNLIHDRLSNETDEQRSHRLNLNHDRLLNETPEARVNRLSAMSHANHIRRKIISDESFQTTINVFADVPCAVCKRTLYPQQRHNLQTSLYGILLPEELVASGIVIACSRCKSNIRKRKIPPTAYWNKMVPAEIPPELADLTAVEERFLCRIVPFLKIVKLNNRFSQNWCQGQVILFAKDVVEIAEQLPLTPNQAGLVLVVESLDNISSCKEFVVDTQKLNRALTWLITNNHLYRDVKAYFNDTSNITPLIQITENSIPEESGAASATSNRYVIINDNKAILRGSFHQGDLRFNSSSGKQCTGIAAVACAAFSISDPNQWCKSDIDYIVIIGDKYYNTCIDVRDNPAPGEVNPEYLAVSDLVPRLKYDRYNVCVTVLEDTNINGHIDNDNSADGFPNLKNALKGFFRDNSNGILTANAISIAVHCRSEAEIETYWLFDSHARGAKGASAPRNGAACCMRFRDLDDVHAVLRRNLFVSPNKVSEGNLTNNVNVFSLTKLNIALDEQIQSSMPVLGQSERNESPSNPPNCNLLQSTTKVNETLQRRNPTVSAQESRPTSELSETIVDSPTYTQNSNSLQLTVKSIQSLQTTSQSASIKEFEQSAMFIESPTYTPNSNSLQLTTQVTAKSVQTTSRTAVTQESRYESRQSATLMESLTYTPNSNSLPLTTQVTAECLRITRFTSQNALTQESRYKSRQSATLLESPTYTPNSNYLQPNAGDIASLQRTNQTVSTKKSTQQSGTQSPFQIHNYLENVYIETTSMLRKIDDNVPNLQSVIRTNNTSTDAMRLAEISRKTAPPLNLERERRMEELAWYFLYPDGKNGFGEERENPVTPLDYFQNRVMSGDKRFNRNEYLFYALSVVEYFRAKSSVSVSCRMRQSHGEHTPQGLVDNMHLTMRNIRGSAAYWQKCCSELIAMVRTLGPPTWFLTFSCNDLNWPDMIKALLIAAGRNTDEAECLTFPERLELVQRHPVVVARQFTLRVNALMRFLKGNHDNLGGPITDFWYRVEFQSRGSPHLHMLVWCGNIPEFSSPQGIEVIENVVSCLLNPDDPELRKLVKDLQIHKHTATCKKHRQDDGCRFGFPKPASDRTVCLGPDEAIANNGRFCLLKRTPEECLVNNYNASLLSIWQGNIDVQPCGSVTAVAYYVAKYASKCEPHDTGEVIREAISKAKRQGGDVWKQLFSVSMAILNQRLVSAPECAYRLCHLPLKMSSRKCVFVNSCRPEERFRLLRFDSDETGIYNNIFDRYVLRPNDLENLSLAEFAVRFETVSNTSWSEEDGDAEIRDEDMTPARYIKLQDNTRMRVRNNAAVLRTRYYTVNSDKEAYYYGLIVCHVPFRREVDLLLENETAEDCFVRRQREFRPLQGNVSAEQFAHAEQIIQQALAQITALNAARECHVDNAPILCVGEQIVNDDESFCEDVGERADMPDEQFLGNIRGLNIQQKDLFQKVSTAIENELHGKENQLLLFVTGGAGSGKSFLLKLIVEHIKRCYAPTVDTLLKPNFVEVGSLTGVAARQIFGKTLHSIFLLPIEKGNTMTYKKITGQRLESERQKWRHINWLIIDEISMVSYENLRIIHLRLQEYKNNDKLFGGVKILLFGDIFQLPPVKGHWCFMQPSWFSAEINLWRQFSFCELTINMRQQNDTEFIDLLNSLRVGELTTAQLELLCERRHVPINGDFADGVAVRIFPTIRQVDEYNDKMRRVNEKLHRTYLVNAVDESREAATYGCKPPDNVIPSDVNNCGGLLSSIIVAIGSRVMLRRNISVSEGLVNGAMGIIKKIKWPALRRDQLEDGELPEAVYIKFDDETIGHKLQDDDACIPIPPSHTTFQSKRGYGDVERRMLPLILCWAVTVHKLQGTTLETAVIDLGKKNFAKGQIYVALSRVRSLEGIVLSDLDANKLLNRPHDDRSLSEIRRFQNLSSDADSQGHS